ncbi:hypothetical protein B7R54_01930 [Subtercola boreus]|uniref:ABM domain-containing protein n=1 Tax=Subtercola boreus TaxID=120213 RepID=A0A3E0VFG4_9MICO|nr:putative quinol monooxygenase [Subtercola boreus]RFA08110.1 hypothetical protein B7R54_01930 [Subtercola boreus]TQL55002.1 quinol monooxygenase YgiN [Subtercola boreus]
MILITGSATAHPEARDRLIALARKVSEATQGDEGCVSYTFAAALDSDAIIGVELWRDRAALDAHMRHEHTQRFIASLDGVLSDAPVMHETEL